MDASSALRLPLAALRVIAVLLGTALAANAQASPPISPAPVSLPAPPPGTFNPPPTPPNIPHGPTFLPLAETFRLDLEQYRKNAEREREANVIDMPTYKNRIDAYRQGIMKYRQLSQ